MSIKKSSKLIIAGIAVLVAALIIAAIATPAFAKSEANNEAKRAVPFSEVNVNDGFMHDYIKLVICNVIPTAIEKVKAPGGGYNNIARCSAWHEAGSDPSQRPAREGALYVDSDVHKVLESICMALDIDPNGDEQIIAKQAELSTELTQWIKDYKHAPEQDEQGVLYPGYFDTFWELTPDYIKYSDPDNHELYCQGHFIEAAVAHYRYQMHKNPSKPDTTLLDIAIGSANHIVNTFGYDTDSGKRLQIPGHEEIELALIKLATLCKEIGGKYEENAQNYIDQAAFFIDARGHDYDKRTADKTILGKREYDQDHDWVKNQAEAVGHAVRAQYLFTGVCDLVSTDQSRYFSTYDKCLKNIWNSITNTKQYVTGGIGDQSNNNEGFAAPYFLPNYRSYCETCAGVANMLFNRSMSTLYDGSQYADHIETDLYNNVLGCINFDGNKFYYQNRINTLGAYDRESWYDTACCPTNYTRTIMQAGGYVYNTTSDNVYINQYFSNKATFSFGTNKTNIVMKSNFPWEAKGSIVVNPTEGGGNFKVSLRNPSWSDSYTIKVNGNVVTPTLQDGYLVIENQTWTTGSTIEFDFSMPIKYEKSNPLVKENEGLVALRHGPIIYCAESAGNEATPDIRKASITPNGAYSFEKVESLDGKPNPCGVRTLYVLNHAGQYAAADGITDVTWQFIPYYARCNRALGPMQVYVFDGSTNALKTHQRANTAASASADMGPTGLNDGLNDEYMRWTNYGDTTPNPFVWYDFETPVEFKGFRIWWYESNSVKPADHIAFTVYNAQENSEQTVEVPNDCIVESNDKFTTYEFPETYEGNAIKMTLYNQYIDGVMKYVGINEWELIDAADNPVNPDITNGETSTPQTGDNAWLAFAAMLLLAVAVIATRKMAYNKIVK